MTTGTDRFQPLAIAAGFVLAVVLLAGLGAVGGVLLGDALTDSATCKGQTAEYDTTFGPVRDLVVTQA